MFLLSSRMHNGVNQPKDHPMHRFPPLPEVARIVTNRLPLPLLPLAEFALFAIMALLLALW